MPDVLWLSLNSSPYALSQLWNKQTTKTKKLYIGIGVPTKSLKCHILISKVHSPKRTSLWGKGKPLINGYHSWTPGAYNILKLLIF